MEYWFVWLATNLQGTISEWQASAGSQGGVESVECSTGMEWWNGIVEWPF